MPNDAGPNDAGPQPVRWAEDVRPEWIDYNGHLSEPYYVLVFGHATDAVMAELGMTPHYLTDIGTSLYTVEAHVRYLDEVPAGSRLEVCSSVIGVTGKQLWLWHEMRCDGRLRATEEVLGMHVDTRAGRSSPFPDELRARAEALLVPPPEHASRRITPK
jgi:acyl-CoA thioester hydrolase